MFTSTRPTPSTGSCIISGPVGHQSKLWPVRHRRRAKSLLIRTTTRTRTLTSVSHRAAHSSPPNVFQMSTCLHMNQRVACQSNIVTSILRQYTSQSTAAPQVFVTSSNLPRMIQCTATPPSVVILMPRPHPSRNTLSSPNVAASSNNLHTNTKRSALHRLSISRQVSIHILTIPAALTSDTSLWRQLLVAQRQLIILFRASRHRRSIGVSSLPIYMYLPQVGGHHHLLRMCRPQPYFHRALPSKLL